MDLIPINKELMMDSRDIAKLTKKRHDHVMRDIRKMLEDLGENNAPKSGDVNERKTGDVKTERKFASSEYKDNKGEMRPCYLLDYELTLTLLTGYSVELRNKVIQRWIYLEKHYKKMRKESIEVRRDFTDELKERGYTKRCEYINTTRAMKKPLAIEHKKDEMTAKELRKIAAAETLAECLLDDEYGYYEVNPVCVEASGIVAGAINRKRLVA